MAWVSLSSQGINDIGFSSEYNQAVEVEPGVFECSTSGHDSFIYGGWAVGYSSPTPRRFRLVVENYAGGLLDPPEQEAFINYYDGSSWRAMFNLVSFPDSNDLFEIDNFEFDTLINLQFTPPIISGPLGPFTASAPLTYRMRLEVWADDVSSNCFWTDKVGVVEDCGSNTPAGFAVIGAHFNTNYGSQPPIAEMEWSSGAPPVLPEGDYGPTDPVSVMDGVSKVVIEDYCGVERALTMSGNSFSATAQMLECGSFYYARGYRVTHDWEAALPSSSRRINKNQDIVVEPIFFAEGSANTAGSMTSATMYYIIGINSYTDAGTFTIGEFPTAGATTITEANTSTSFSYAYDNTIGQGEAIIGIAANGNNWAGGAGSYSHLVEGFFRPPMYALLAGRVRDVMYYPDGDIVGDDVLYVESATDPVVYDKGGLLLFESAYYYPPDDSTNRYGHRFVPENDDESAIYFDTGSGVLVGDFYKIEGGVETFLGKVAFKYKPAS